MNAVVNLVDSHCHLDKLDLSDNPAQLYDVLQAARKCGVNKILSVATDLNNSVTLPALAEQYGNIVCSVGVHPLQKASQPVPSVEQLLELAKHPLVVALGETGLDNYYGDDNEQWQQDSFVNHLIAAQQFQLPVIVHTRQAQQKTIELLTRYRSESGGVLHCFTEDWPMAKQSLDLGFYISFSGIVTFRNADALREVVRQVPLDRMMVETDAPWLTPVPYRGQQNLPQYVYEVAQYIADLRGVAVEELAAITTENFYRLFSKA